MSDIVIGVGQIGLAVRAVTESEYSYDTFDDPFNVLDYPAIDVMHICFPPSDDFEQQVRSYAAALKPKHIAIWSTVPIGTCGKIDARVIHTPVEGVHPDLELSIRTMVRWIGANDQNEGKWFAQYFNALGLKTKVVPNSSFTEAIKLLSTSEYGVNLVFADYKKKIADSLDIPYDLMKQWNTDYNRLYIDLGLGGRYQKFVLDAPEGNIGGHCVRPNAALLNRQYPYEMLELIVAMDGAK